MLFSVLYKATISNFAIWRSKSPAHVPEHICNSTAQWDTAPAFPELHNIAFQVYGFPNQAMPAAFRALSFKQEITLPLWKVTTFEYCEPLQPLDYISVCKEVIQDRIPVIFYHWSNRSRFLLLRRQRCFQGHELWLRRCPLLTFSIRSFLLIVTHRFNRSLYFSSIFCCSSICRLKSQLA